VTRIGTAGWSIPRASAAAFPAEGSALQRYAARLSAVEINSSFYRAHKPETWARWGDAVPETFRFSVKLPKAATHVLRLVDTGSTLDAFFAEVAALGSKLGPVLVQLPPSLQFDADVTARFLDDVRKRSAAAIVIEPRHASWLDAETLLADRRVARVAADPPRYEADAEPGGWRGLSYWRLHGSPAIYRSSYADRLPQIAAGLAAAPGDAWCIFDNTMTGAATADALALQASGTARNSMP
jgi:uncharacterized protein YecE (DUF72 family)